MSLGKSSSWFEALTTPAKPNRTQRVLAYRAARASVVLLIAVTFFVINAAGAWLIGRQLTDGVLSVSHARYFWAVGLGTTAFFAGQGGALGLLDAYVRGRVQLPARGPCPAKPAAPQNPWAVALSSLCTWGAIAAAISCWVAPRHGVPLARFCWQFASWSAALSAVIVLQRTGAPFLEQARLEPRQRRFAGTLGAYVWQRHVLPQGVVNTVVNAWIGVAIMPAELGAVHAQASIPAAFVRLDFAGAALLLALLIAAGVRGQTQLDRLSGVIDALPRSPPRAVRVFGAFAIIATLSCVTIGIGIRAVGVAPYLVARAIFCGLLSATVAYWSALRTLAILPASAAAPNS
jgi:hypothetical protein